MDEKEQKELLARAASRGSRDSVVAYTPVQRTSEPEIQNRLSGTISEISQNLESQHNASIHDLLHDEQGSVPVADASTPVSPVPSGTEALDNLETPGTTIVADNSPVPEAPTPKTVYGSNPAFAGADSKKRIMLILLGVGAGILLLVIGLIVLGTANSKKSNKNDKDQAITSIPSSDLLKANQKESEARGQVIVNGPLQVKNKLILSPSSKPENPELGQIYFDGGTNQFTYYDGKNYQSLVTNQSFDQLSSLSRAGPGQGLALTGQSLINTGVLTVQGQAGNISFTGGPGLVVNGLQLTNTGVLSVQGTAGNVVFTGGAGIAVNGTQIVNTGVLSVAGSANQINVSTINGVATFSLPQDIATTSTPTFNGVTLANALSIANGGTGSVASSFFSNGAAYFDGTKLVSTATASGAGLCLVSTAGAPAFAACPGGGASIGGSGTIGKIAYFDTSSSIADSILSQSGTALTIAGSITGVTTLATSGTINGATISGGTLSGGAVSGGTLSGGNVSGGSLTNAAVNGLLVAANALSTAAGDLSIDAFGSGVVRIGSISTGNIELGGGSTANGCTLDNTNGDFACSGTINGASVSGGTLNGATITGGQLSATQVNNLNVGPNAISTSAGNLSIDANGAGTVDIGGNSTGNVTLGGGFGSTGCTVNNGTGDFDCNGKINGATIVSGTLNGADITGGTMSGGTITGGKLSDTFVNSLNVNLDGTLGTNISSSNTFLKIDAQGNNVVNIGSISTGDILFAGGFGTTGCSVSNATGALDCDGKINGITINSDKLIFGASSAAGITAGGTGQDLSLNGSTTGVVKIADVSTGGVQIGGSGTGDILFGGGSGSTGCTLVNATGNFDCSGTFNGLSLNNGVHPTIGITGKMLTIQNNVDLNQSLLTTSSPVFAGLTAGSLAPNAGTGLTIGALGALQTTLVQGNGVSFKNVGNALTINYAFANGQGTKVDGGSYDICDTSGNCSGLNGAVSATGTTSSPYIAIFSGSQSITNSIISQDAVSGATKAIIDGDLTLNKASAALNGTAALTVSSTGGANALTLTSGSGILMLGGSTTTVQRNGSALTFDLLNASSASTLTITNSNAGQVAHLSVEGGLNIGSGQTYKINNVDINTAGTLNNVAYLNANNTFTGTGTTSFASDITIAGGKKINSQTIGSASTFTGTVEIQGTNALTLGKIGPAGNTGAIIFRNSAGSNTVTLKASDTNPASSIVFTLPSAPGTAGYCLSDTDGSGTLGFVNCSSGLSVSGTPTDGRLLMFTSSGSAVTNSSLFDNGTSVSIQGANNSLLIAGGTVGGSGNNSISLGTASSRTGGITLYNESNANTVSLVSGTTTGSYSLILPTALDTTGKCLSVGAGGQISYFACAAVSGGGGASNVTANAVTNGHLTVVTQDTGTIIVGDSIIQDNGSRVGVGVAPDATAVFTVGSSSAFKVTNAGALSVAGITNTATGINNGNFGITSTGSLAGVTTLSATGLLQTSVNGQALTLSGATSSGNSLFLLGPNVLTSGSINGTYVGANPTTFGGNFVDFQVSGVSMFKITSVGDIVAGKFNGVTIQGSGTVDTGSGNTLTLSGSANLDQNLRQADSPTFNGLSLTNALTPANGGTGRDNSTAAAGDILFFDTTLSAFKTGAIGTDGSIAVTQNNSGVSLAVTSCSTCANTALSNLSGTTSLNSSLLAQANIDLGGVSNPFRSLYLGSGSNNVKLNTNATVGTFTLTLPNATGTLCYVDGGGAGNCTGSNGGSGNTNYIFNQTAQQTDANINILARTATVASVVQGAAGQDIAHFNKSDGSSGVVITSAGNITGGTYNGATISSTAFNGLAISGTSVAATGALAIDANGVNTISLGSTSTGDILLGGGYGATGCTVANSTGNLACSGSLSTGVTGTTTGSIVFYGSTLASGNITLVGPSNPSVNNYTLTIPALTANNTVCTIDGTGAGNCTGTNSGGGNTNYILNQTNQQTAANINIQSRASNVAAVFQGASGQDIVHFDSSAGPTVAKINSAGALTAVGVDSGTGIITGTGGLTITGGTGTNINDNANFNTKINTGTSTGTVAIGGTSNTGFTIEAGTGAANLFNGTTAHTVNFATGAAVQTITIGSIDTTSLTKIQGGATGSISIGAVLTETNSSTVKIANTTDGTGTQSVSIGSTANAANALTLQSGSTNGVIVKADGSNSFRVQNSTGSTTILTADATNKRLSLSDGNATTANLFVLDSSSTAPVAVAGGLYFDTASSSIKCSLDGSTFTSTCFGTGGIARTKKIVLTPEFVGAVLDAAGDASCSSANTGSMTSGLVTTGVGDVPASRQMSYYNWSSTQSSLQCYDVVVQVPIPSDFGSWSGNPDIFMKATSTNTANATYGIKIIDSANTGETNYNYSSVTGLTTNWADVASNSLAGTYTAGDFFTIKIRMSAKTDTTPTTHSVSLGNIVLTYTSAY